MTLQLKVLADERSEKHLAGKHNDFSACAGPVDAIRLAADQWQEFLESSPDPIWIKDGQGRYVAVNKAYLRADPAQTQDVIGKTDFEVQSRDKAEMYVADDHAAIVLFLLTVLAGLRQAGIL